MNEFVPVYAIVIVGLLGFLAGFFVGGGVATKLRNEEIAEGHIFYIYDEAYRAEPVEEEESKS